MTFGFGFGRGFGGGGFGRRGFGRRGYRGGYFESDAPQFRGREDVDRTPITEMARMNNWGQEPDLPSWGDGQRVDISGGPFAPGRYRVNPPVVSGQAGYWTFYATTVTAQTRGDQWRPYALTFLAMPGEMPFVHVYPESWRASVTSVMPEVHLESGEFNDRFATFAEDARTVYGLLSPRAMQALIEHPPFDELWTAHSLLCLARIDPHNAGTLDEHLRLLTAIAQGIPSSLWER